MTTNREVYSSSQMNEVQILTWLKTLKSPITTTQPPIPFSSSCISPNRELLYEGKILETLIKNSERLAILEQKLIILDQKIVTLDQKIDKVDAKVDSYKWYFITIIIGIIINIFSQPIVSWLF